MEIFAHGVGGAQDLPIPAAYAIGGSGAALTVSFAILMLAWRRPRFNVDHATPNQWLTALLDSPAFTVATRTLGLIGFAYVAWAAVFGPDLATNPTFGVVYVLIWVGLVPVSLLLGPVWKAISPTRAIYGLLSLVIGGPKRDAGRLTLPGWVGYWPAAAGLFAFVWLEMVYDHSTYLTPVRLWFAIYITVLIVGGLLFGARWFERADPFEVYSNLLAKLAVVGRRSDGTLALQSPLNNLSGVQTGPGLVAVIAVLLGSTAYDSFTRSTTWLGYLQATDISATLLATVALLGFCLLVALTFSAATIATGVDGHMRRTALPGLFAHSVVPIIVGYMIAHYLTLLVEYGQQTLILLSDPMGTGANLLGTGHWQVNYVLSTQPTTLAVIKVLAVLTGHVLGVIAAHDRAITLLPARHQITGQLPLLFVMVGYTVGGLYLLFSG